jgi:hypothetical protein
LSRRRRGRGRREFADHKWINPSDEADSEISEAIPVRDSALRGGLLADNPLRIGLAADAAMQNQFSNGATEMKVEITKPPVTFAEGILKGVSEQDASYPHIVIEMSVKAVNEPVRVTLDEIDLSTIMRLARDSTVPRIRDAVRFNN